ncbi:hypothetical protein [Methylophaga thiooxydans]|uniref:hypothetical protein n=1 Tax=Methylophaga thiooxydans TaxID=392484 RepID=UPI0005C5EE02|nr:hypothetical protein [Methylophaga thiooxydans]
MDESKDWALINLSDFAGLLDQALEGEGLDFDDRIFYTGHLATCARMFRSIILSEPSSELLKLIDLESTSYKLASRPNERGAIVKEGWLSIQPILHQCALALENA